MKTEIDNNQRVFQVIDSYGRNYFCNLKDLNNVIKENNLREGYYKVFHFWNGKPKRATKKLLTEMFQASGIVKEF
jgi:DNA topoisomerase IB